jgi:hypothetical protein
MNAQALNTINVLTTRRNLAAKLVTMPGRPGAVIADVFLSMVADD